MANAKQLESSSSSSTSTAELFLAYDNLKQNTASASPSETDPSNNAHYRMTFHATKPQIVIESTSSGSANPLARVSYHNWSTKADVEIFSSSGKREILLQPKSKLSTKPEYKYASPSLGGAGVSWQTQGSFKGYFDFVLLEDESAMPLARFTAAGIRGNWSLKKLGRMELMPGVVGKPGVVDELVTTLIAILYYHIMQVNSTGTIAAASASGSAASAAATVA